MVVALNMMDIAERRGIHVSPETARDGTRRAGHAGRRPQAARASTSSRPPSPGRAVAPLPDWPLPAGDEGRSCSSSAGGWRSSTPTRLGRACGSASDATRPRSERRPHPSPLLDLRRRTTPPPRPLPGDRRAAAHRRPRRRHRSRSRRTARLLAPRLRRPRDCATSASTRCRPTSRRTTAGSKTSSPAHWSPRGTRPRRRASRRPSPAASIEYEPPRRRDPHREGRRHPHPQGLGPGHLRRHHGGAVRHDLLARRPDHGRHRSRRRLARRTGHHRRDLADGPLKDLLADGIFAGVGARRRLRPADRAALPVPRRSWKTAATSPAPRS